MPPACLLSRILFEEDRSCESSVTALFGLSWKQDWRLNKFGGKLSSVLTSCRLYHIHAVMYSQVSRKGHTCKQTASSPPTCSGGYAVTKMNVVSIPEIPGQHIDKCIHLRFHAGIQNSSYHENGHSLECQKVNFLEYLGQGTCGCHSLSSLLLGPSAAPQTFTLTAASYWHWTSTSLHSIRLTNSFPFFSWKSKRISSKYHTATSKHRQATWKGH